MHNGVLISAGGPVHYYHANYQSSSENGFGFGQRMFTLGPKTPPKIEILGRKPIWKWFHGAAWELCFRSLMLPFTSISVFITVRQRVLSTCLLWTLAELHGNNLNLVKGRESPGTQLHKAAAVKLYLYMAPHTQLCPFN